MGWIDLFPLVRRKLSLSTLSWHRPCDLSKVLDETTMDCHPDDCLQTFALMLRLQVDHQVGESESSKVSSSRLSQ